MFLNQRITRRNFLGIAGLSSVLTFPKLSEALALNPISSKNFTPEDISEAILRVRDFLTIRSSLKHGINDLRIYVAQTNSDYFNWESHRRSIFESLPSSSSWSANFIDSNSVIELKNYEVSGETLILSIYEWLQINWQSVFNKKVKTENYSDLESEFPEKYDQIQNPSRLINSGLGIEHTFTMVKSGNLWRILDDSYSETPISGNSPSYKNKLVPNNFALKAKPKSSRLDNYSLTARTFDYMSAVNYAKAWCGALGSPQNMTSSLYNAQYTNFVPNDCANYVSECFSAGGYPNDSQWFYNSISGSAVNPSSSGSPTRDGSSSSAWINNASLRNWLIASGRGVQMSSMSGLGLADIVNFRTTASAAPFHVMIVTGINANSQRLLSAHTSNQKDWVYIPNAYAPATYDLYTRTLLNYSA